MIIPVRLIRRIQFMSKLVNILMTLIQTMFQPVIANQVKVIMGKKRTRIKSQKRKIKKKKKEK